MVTDICLSQPAQEKRERITFLLNEVSKLYERRECMITYERVHLTTVYAELIGRLQLEVFETETAVRKLKRTSELIQAQRNRGEKVNMGIINRTVELEFAEQERQLQMQLEELKQARAYLDSPHLCEEESAELKSLYRALMKRLHPDWNPVQTDQEKDLFLRAKAAYNSCDLQELRNILLMCDMQSNIDSIAPDEMDERIAKLEQSLRDLRQRIDQLNTTFPFTYRDKLKDEAWVAEEQEKLREKIKRLEAERRTWEIYISTQMDPNATIGLA